MKWKDAKLEEVEIRSTIGGNLRLRVPNPMKFGAGGSLQTASGKNGNSFYQVEETPAAVISPKATLLLPQLKETFIYDIKTEAGKSYRLIAE